MCLNILQCLDNRKLTEKEGQVQALRPTALGWDVVLGGGGRTRVGRPPEEWTPTTTYPEFGRIVSVPKTDNHLLDPRGVGCGLVRKVTSTLRVEKKSL